MPHKNPKIDQLEKDTFAAIQGHGKQHGKKEKATLTRSAVRAAALQIAANTRAIAQDPALVLEGVEHTENSIDAILDAIEAAS